MMEVNTSGPVVNVLSQLDARYFKGLAREYSFVVKFRPQKAGEQDYLVRSHSSHSMGRSVNAQITLTGSLSRRDENQSLPSRRRKLYLRDCPPNCLDEMRETGASRSFIRPRACEGTGGHIMWTREIED
ncbi:hypothetical protein ACN38_g1041 [Penicillium nordicum]|uniref:Uncharacterized protein n=1 Tax=Penicillium nordicum TaxID=229535 RepID=A0A0M8P9M1_9EURO|nr:hypothetical protein ACN38_g1041 [Penicillium nordicum]